MPHEPGLPIERLRKALAHSYSIDRELGRGGMASVFLAQDQKHARSVAIKVLHPALAASLGAERFLQEILLAGQLNHPHILPMFDSGNAAGFLYYVMPYVEGESLRERLDREQLLPVEEALRHARAIASALDYAHRLGIVHRDVKPENVMLYEGEAMLMDFGIAKALSAAGAGSLTQTGMMVGTPAYVSPEQAAGEPNIDGRSDQYSLACMLYEMLTGERPFDAATAQAVMTKRFTEAPRSPRGLRACIPEIVERSIAKAMTLDASGRFATTAEFGQALALAKDAASAVATQVQPAVPAAAKSVAVLPFANMSADPDNEYFSDGMAEEIRTALSRIQTLRVASRTSSFAFKGRNEDIGRIGRKLKVSTVLEGSIRRSGNRLRIAAQLVNVTDGYQLWTERYDREMEDVFAIQDEIAQAIVRALRVILSDDEKKQIERPRAVNVEAYDFYLRGQHQVYLYRRKSLELALLMFGRAIEIDPTYARAYAGLADCYAALYTSFGVRETSLAQAESASRMALEFEPGLAESHLARARAVLLSGQFDEATREFEEALRIDPQLFDAAYWYARALVPQGKFEQALLLFLRAASLRPEDYQPPSFIAMMLESLGRHDEAQDWLRKQFRLIEQHVELDPDDARALMHGALARAKVQDAEGATVYAARAIALDPEDPNLLYNMACMYAILGNAPDCMSALEQAVRRGFCNKGWLEHDSDFDSMRAEPRYLALMQAM